MTKIDKGIPIPSYRHKKQELDLPFDEMKVGDSFFFPKVNRQLGNATTNFTRLSPKRFVTRCEGTGRRCWRLK